MLDTIQLFRIQCKRLNFITTICEHIYYIQTLNIAYLCSTSGFEAEEKKRGKDEMECKAGNPGQSLVEEIENKRSDEPSFRPISTLFHGFRFAICN